MNPNQLIQLIIIAYSNSDFRWFAYIFISVGTSLKNQKAENPVIFQGIAR